MSAVRQKLQSLQSREAQLREQRQQILASIANTAKSELSSVASSNTNGTAGPQQASAGTRIRQQHSPGPPIAKDPTLLVAELASLQACHAQAQRLQELQAAVKHLDRQLRGVELAQGDAGVAPFVEAVTSAVRAYKAALPARDRLSSALRESGVHLQAIHSAAEALLGRVAAAQVALRAAVEGQLQLRLAQIGWPPPLADMQAGASSSGSGSSGGWRGFEDAPGDAVHDVQQLMAALVTLQQAVEEAAFRAALEGGDLVGPLLWAVQAFTAPVGRRLRLHFASGLPTDRPDKPEWLLGTALKVARSVSPQLAPLQPVIDSLGLGSCYDVRFEAARAVREEAKAILAQHMLPALAAMGGAGGARGQGGAQAQGQQQQRDSQRVLWRHVADEMISFERRLAPLHGVLLEPGDAAAAALPGWCSGSVLSVMFEDPEWSAAWFSAELAAAQAEVDAVADSPAGWRPLPSVWGEDDLGDDDGWSGLTGGGSNWAQPSHSGRGASVGGLPSSSSSRAAAAGQEFWPPACAEALLSSVTSAVRRSGWCGSRLHRRRYLKEVPGQLLKSFRARLQRECKVAEGYGDLAGPTWAPRLAACICAAHYLEHHLREPEVMALLDVESATGASSLAFTGGALPGTASGAATPASSVFSPTDSIASFASRASTVLTTAGGGPGMPPPPSGSLASILEREASALAWVKKEWSLKLAKVLATEFADKSRPYRRRLERFAADGDVADGGVSPTLLPALERLQSSLALLASHMDAVVFRDCWRAVAVAANRMLFNEVATEARFSETGAAQFCTDVRCLVALLSSWTPRPGAHFKELREASDLLSLPRGQLAQLLHALAAQDPKAARAALASAGVHRLTAQQAAAVVAQRVDAPLGWRQQQ